MDKKTFWVELIKALAWPLTTLAIIFIHKRNLVDLLKRLTRFKHGDTEATFDLEKVRTDMAELNIVPEMPDELLFAEIAPLESVISAFERIENVLNQIYFMKHGLKRPRVHEGLIREMIDEKIILPKFMHLYRTLLRMKNDARDRKNISAEQASQYVVLSGQFAKHLEAIFEKKQNALKNEPLPPPQ